MNNVINLINLTLVGQDFIYLFIFAMIEESEYYAKILKTIFNKIFNKTIATLLENIDNLLIADVI